MLHLRRRRHAYAALQMADAQREGACMRDVLLVLKQALPAKSGASLPPSKRSSAMWARHVRHAAFRHAVLGVRHRHVPQTPSLSSLLLHPHIRSPSLPPVSLFACLPSSLCGSPRPVRTRTVRRCFCVCVCVCLSLSLWVSWATPAGKRAKATIKSSPNPDPSGGAGGLHPLCCSGKGAEALWIFLFERANRLLRFQGWPGLSPHNPLAPPTPQYRLSYLKQGPR